MKSLVIIYTGLFVLIGYTNFNNLNNYVSELCNKLILVETSLGDLSKKLARDTCDR